MTLPPLPDGIYYYCYTADQMLAYGAACAAAERERCAKLCEAEHRLGLDDERAYYGRLMADAIRAQETP